MEYGRGTGLIVVDMQNDFADPQGGLYVPGGEDVVPVVNREIEQAMAAGSPVFYTQDWHPPSTPHFAKDGGVWPVHCVADTWGAELHPTLIVSGPVVRKGIGGEDGYSGFTVRDPVTGAASPTELAGLLRDAGVERVNVVGLALDYCVKETATDAAGLGFDTTVDLSATAAVNLEPGDSAAAEQELVASGVTLV